MRRTKIVCTMGPSSSSVDVLKSMIAAGMNVARLNMAHGELEQHSEQIKRIRQAEKETGSIVPVLMDIKGPEIRIGLLKEASCELVAGDTLTLTSDEIQGDAARISVNYKDLPEVIKPGDKILIDDGLIELRVTSVNGTEIHCLIRNGGTLKPRKGVNLPGIRTTLPGVTDRDIRHIEFGIEENIDIIAMSFVRKAEDVLTVRQLLEERGCGHIQIISKIENQEGVDELEAIVEASDGIMVARGDLGVEIPVEDVPVIQKWMIETCSKAGKPVIVATQMLDSMQQNPRPTRAEVSDVANAVLEGADAVMLSGETAAGRYPVESVLMMATVAVKAESLYLQNEQRISVMPPSEQTITEIISSAAVGAAAALQAKAILIPTESGFTPRMVSKHRPKSPILAVTRSEQVLRRMCLLWGVTPLKGETVQSTDDMFEQAVNSGLQSGLLVKGDYTVITAGVPIGESGSTNLIKIKQV
ncbi:pyruvate kinase [Paenibacillus lutrae]|uniref:Pyruvate kinase n=1 Tax=Paenibacillus lutrae TaxID=2078573 RepID=A0A7X3FLN4_9BACL|nr:pyruvate kinase [Paenibacillus lutrae]MVP02054.1 pyruvate kinase [Paenibacillus lutrae]